MLFKVGDFALVKDDAADIDHAFPAGTEVVLLEYREKYDPGYHDFPAWYVAPIYRFEEKPRIWTAWVAESDLVGVAVDPKEIHQAIQSIKGKT